MKNVPTKTAGGKHPLAWINISKNDVWNKRTEPMIITRKNQESQAKSKMAKLEEHHE